MAAPNSHVGGWDAYDDQPHLDHYDIPHRSRGPQHATRATMPANDIDFEFAGSLFVNDTSSANDFSTSNAPQTLDGFDLSSTDDFNVSAYHRSSFNSTFGNAQTSERPEELLDSFNSAPWFPGSRIDQALGNVTNEANIPWGRHHETQSHLAPHGNNLGSHHGSLHHLAPPDLYTHNACRSTTDTSSQRSTSHAGTNEASESLRSESRFGTTLVHPRSVADGTAICPKCQQHFTGRYSKGNRARHIRQQHSGRSGDSHHNCMCRICKKSFKRQDARRKHEWRKHNIPECKPSRRDQTLSQVQTIYEAADDDNDRSDPAISVCVSNNIDDAASLMHSQSEANYQQHLIDHNRRSSEPYLDVSNLARASAFDQPNTFSQSHVFKSSTQTLQPPITGSADFTMPPSQTHMPMASTSDFGTQPSNQDVYSGGSYSAFSPTFGSSQTSYNTTNLAAQFQAQETDPPSPCLLDNNWQQPFNTINETPSFPQPQSSYYFTNGAPPYHEDGTIFPP